LLSDILEDNIPAYILARLDNPVSEWLAIFYVPETAKVKDKMLYASTRNSLTKFLGSAHFTDSIFATTKADVTPDAYVKHKLHLAAPKPLSAREQELADLAAAEKQNSGHAYQGSIARSTPLTSGLGLKWTQELQDALNQLGTDDSSRVLVLTVDPSSETLVLSETVDCDADSLGASLPKSEPSYGFFAWSHSFGESLKREIVFIYCCPSSSPVKHRMLYSSGALLVYQGAKSILESAGGDQLAGRKIETSDPQELNEAFLKEALGVGHSNESAPTSQSQPLFAKPKGPGRRR